MNKIEKRAGLIAGISLIVMAIAAGFSYGYVHSSIVAETPCATAQNIANNRLIFLAGIVGWFVIFLTDLIVTFSLLKFFNSTNKIWSQITAGLRLIYTLILGVAVYQLVSIYFIQEPISSANMITLLLQRFEQIWSFGLIIFGLHLIGLGYLIINSIIVSKLFGYLLYLGGVLYTLTNIFKLTNILNTVVLQNVIDIAALPMALAELLLAIWLIFKGFKNEKKAN